MSIGVIICRCNGVIDLDFDKLRDEISDNDVKVFVRNAICIDKEPWSELKKNNISKLVIAACSPQFHERTFRNMLKNVTLSVPFSIVNLKEHVAFVHRDKKLSYEKSKAMIKATIEKMKNIKEETIVEEIKPNKNVLIIGAGVSGLKVAECLERLGFEPIIIEKNERIGGIIERLPKIYPYNVSGKEFLNNIIKNLRKTKIITNAEVSSVLGKFGNYSVTVIRRENNTIEIMNFRVPCIIIATGIEEWKPFDITYLKYGRVPNVITQLELSEKLMRNEDIKANRIFMQLCVGSRDEKFYNYCSKMCCIYTLENAIELRKRGKEVFIGYMDIRTIWKAEELFNEARKLGIKFIRGKVANVTEKNGVLKLSVENTLENVVEDIEVDLLVLSSALKAPDTNKDLSQILDVELDEHNFFKKLYYKLREIETRKRGIYVIGSSTGPKSIEDCIIEAKATAKKIATEVFLPRLRPRAPSVIDEKLCIGCQICYKVCPHKAIEMIITGDGEKARVLVENCKSCGACVANCPTGAAQLEGYTTEQMLQYIETLIKEAKMDKKIATFVCYECGYAALDMIGIKRLKYSESYLIIPVPCLARVGMLDIFKALSSGADGVLLIGCLENGCHYLKGNEYATYLVGICKDILDAIGVEKERIDIIKVTNADYYKLYEKLIEFHKKIISLPKLEVGK